MVDSTTNGRESLPAPMKSALKKDSSINMDDNAQNKLKLDKKVSVSINVPGDGGKSAAAEAKEEEKKEQAKAKIDKGKNLTPE